jgi:hypothetical protein
VYAQKARLELGVPTWQQIFAVEAQRHAVDG